MYDVSHLSAKTSRYIVYVVIYDYLVGHSMQTSLVIEVQYVSILSGHSEHEQNSTWMSFEFHFRQNQYHRLTDIHTDIQTDTHTINGICIVDFIKAWSMWVAASIDDAILQFLYWLRMAKQELVQLKILNEGIKKENICMNQWKTLLMNHRFQPN